MAINFQHVQIGFITTGIIIFINGFLILRRREITLKTKNTNKWQGVYRGTASIPFVIMWFWSGIVISGYGFWGYDYFQDNIVDYSLAMIGIFFVLIFPVAIVCLITAEIIRVLQNKAEERNNT